MMNIYFYDRRFEVVSQGHVGYVFTPHRLSQPAMFVRNLGHTQISFGHLLADLLSSTHIRRKGPQYHFTPISAPELHDIYPTVHHAVGHLMASVLPSSSSSSTQQPTLTLGLTSVRCSQCAQVRNTGTRCLRSLLPLGLAREVIRCRASEKSLVTDRGEAADSAERFDGLSM